MCGLAGHIGLKDEKQRLAFTIAVALELDTRGGHGAGFLASDGKNIRHGRTEKTWAETTRSFITPPGLAKVCCLHSRFATCGNLTKAEAHPFPIRRNGKPVLYGMHNGMLDGAEESAAAHGRKFMVDSKEMFELLVDGELDQLRKMHGYGVAIWMNAPNPHRVSLLRLSYMSEIVAAKIKGQGVVWASTWWILRKGVEAANLDVDFEYAPFKVGKLHHITENGVVIPKGIESLRLR